MDKKGKIVLYSTIATLCVSYIVYNKMRKNILFEEIMKRIGGGGAKWSDLTVWKPNFMLEIKATNKEYITYKQSKIREMVMALREAMKGEEFSLTSTDSIFSTVGTDEDKIFSIFEGLNSKVGVAEINSFYQAKFGNSLKSDLESELTASELAKLSTIISLKPNVIYL